MSQPIDTASVQIVPDFSAFTRELKAGIDSALRSMQVNVEQAFSQVEREVANTGRAIARDFEVGTESAQRSINDLRGENEQQMARIRAESAATGFSISDKLGGAFALVKTGLMTAGLAAGAALGAMTVFGLKSAAALEQTQIGLTALIGNADTAKTFLGQLQQFAAVTPFQFAGVSDAARRILAFGSAVGITREQVIPTLTTIGDLVSVLGGGQAEIDSVVRALGQMASAAHVNQQDVMQLAQALPGFNVNAAIAAKLGVSTADALNMITSGAISGADGVNIILSAMGKFPGAAGAMALQAQTLVGVFSTFKDTISIALTNAFQPVIPAIKQNLTDVTPILGDALNQLAPVIGAALGALLPLVGDLVKGIAPILAPLVQFIGDFVKGAGGALGPLGASIGNVLQQIVPLAPILAKLSVELLSALIPAFQKWGPELPPLIKSLTDLAVASLPLIPPLTQILTLMAQMSDANILALSASIEQFAAVLNLLTGADWGGIFSSIGATLSGWASAVGRFFSELPGKIGSFLSGLPAMLASLATQAFDAFTFAVGFGIGAILRFFIDLPGNIAALITQLWDRAKALFQSGSSNAQSTVSTMVDRVIGFFAALPGRALAAIESLPGQIIAFGGRLVAQAISLGEGIVTGIVRGIQNMIGSVGSTLQRGLDNVLSGVKHGLGISSPSKLWADEVGEPIPAGVAVGVRSGYQDVRDALAPVSPSGSLGAGLPVAAPAAAASPLASGGFGGSIAVFVTIDGQQLQGRITDTIENHDRAVAQTVNSRRGTR